MTNERLRYLLDRYLNNTATEEELQEYADWYKEAAAKGDKLFDHAYIPEAQEFRQELFGAIINNIQAAEQEQKWQTGKRRLLFFKCAAAAVVVVAGMFVLRNALKNTPATTVAKIKPLKDVTRPTIIAVKNKSGRKHTIHLQDGSVVDLHAGSELRYEEPFNPKHRDLYLSGKAFFKVARDTAKPFTVYSHDIATTALGTSFTITAWPQQPQVAVSLHTGKVKVQHMAQGSQARIKDMYLLPGQQVTCHVNTGIALLQSTGNKLATVNHVSLGARTGLAIVFNDEPMSAVLDSIAKGYSVSLQYDKEVVTNMVFTGRIQATDSLSQVLKRIAILYNLTITATGKKYIIRKNQ